jgi:fatty acid desaturase
MSTTRVLSGAEIRALSGRSDAKGAVRTLGHAAFIAVGVWLIVIADRWTLIPAMFVLGIALATLFAPTHETMHLTAFKSRRANAVVGGGGGWPPARRCSTGISIRRSTWRITAIRRTRRSTRN